MKRLFVGGSKWSVPLPQCRGQVRCRAIVSDQWVDGWDGIVRTSDVVLASVARGWTGGTGGGLWVDGWDRGSTGSWPVLWALGSIVRGILSLVGAVGTGLGSGLSGVWRNLKMPMFMKRADVLYIHRAFYGSQTNPCRQPPPLASPVLRQGSAWNSLPSF